MLALRFQDPDALFNDFIRRWFKLLAQGRVAEACAMLDEPNCYGLTWTPDEIQQALHVAFAGAAHFWRAHPDGPSVSDPDTARGMAESSVIAYADDGGFSVEHAVPINGHWSEMTAQFEFLLRDRAWAVVLHDLRVTPVTPHPS